MKRRALIRKTRKFLDLSVEQRNKLVDTFIEVKQQLKRSYYLKELGLNGSWDNITLPDFLHHPEHHYMQIIRSSRKKNISKAKLMKSILKLYKVVNGQAIFRHSKSESLNRWSLKPIKTFQSAHSES